MVHLSHDDHVSQSRFSFSQGLVLRIWVCVLVFSCLSLGFFLCRRVTFVTCRDRESWWWFFCSHTFLFWLENTMYCHYDETIHKWRLWWLPSSVACGIFSKTSILVVSFGLHQWIQLVDRISMYLAQLVVCSDCREGARQCFLSMFHTLHHSQHHCRRAQRWTC